jgi:hypothetical protein
VILLQTTVEMPGIFFLPVKYARPRDLPQVRIQYMDSGISSLGGRSGEAAAESGLEFEKLHILACRHSLNDA